MLKKYIAKLKRTKTKNNNQLIFLDENRRIHVFRLFNDKEIGIKFKHKRSYIFQVPPINFFISIFKIKDGDVGTDDE